MSGLQNVNLMSRAQAALAYAKLGIPVFPCRGKRPITKHGFKDASLDQDVISQWWKNTPDANIGSPTGRRSFVLDVDMPDGPESLARLEQVHGALPATLEQKTGGGGRHLFFALPEEHSIRNSAKKLGAGLDIRGSGGYVILAPSIHESGEKYEWVQDVPPATPPKWLMELLVHPAQSQRVPVESPTAFIQGQRNTALNSAAFALGKRIILEEADESAGLAELVSQAKVSGLEDQEINATLRSGLEAGKRAGEREYGKNPFLDMRMHGWPTPGPNMFHGLAGDFARMATRRSEADPVAVLATVLCRFAVEVGRGPFMLAGEKQHARLNAIIVGQSSKARKGTSARPVRELFRFAASESWPAARVSPGPLSSGEGLVFAVRDPQEEYIVDKRSGSGKMVQIDPGTEDKRLFVLDQEFAGALSCTRREGNILSTIIRALFDGDKVEPLTKTNKIAASAPHIGIVSHITLHELLKKLDATEAFNGFANRFLWLCVRRPKKVAFPEEIEPGELLNFQKQLLHVLNASQQLNRIRFDKNARDLWEETYPRISDDRPALLGAILNRAEVYVRRLALTYALLDGESVVSSMQLQAALDFWKYCEDSAAFIFGGMEGDSLEQRIVDALGKAGGSLDTTGLYQAFGNHITKAEMTMAMNALSASGKIHVEEKKPPKGGRTKKIFHLCEVCEESKKLEVSPSEADASKFENSHSSQDEKRSANVLSCDENKPVPMPAMGHSQPTRCGHSHSGAGQGMPPLEPCDVNGDGERK